MNFAERRRALLSQGGEKQFFIFREGQGGLENGALAKVKTSHSFCTFSSGRIRLMGGYDANNAYSGLYLIGTSPTITSKYYNATGAFGADVFKGYKTLNFEMSLQKVSNKPLYTGLYGLCTPAAKKWKEELSNSSSDGMQYPTMRIAYPNTTARAIYSLNIAGITGDWFIALNTPIGETQAYIYNIWLE